jgi:hypothetical protein
MNKPVPGSTERAMEYVEITQAEEMPVLSDAERADLLQSLKDAEARLDRGEGIVFQPGAFGSWMRERIKELRSSRRRAL